MASKPYPLRIPENLLSLVDSKAKDDRTDRSTALRQLLYVGAEDYVIELLKRERISTSRAAELLDISLYRVQEMAREHNVGIPSKAEDYERGRDTARQLLK